MTPWRLGRFGLFAVLIICAPIVSQAMPQIAQSAIHYTVTLANPRQHLLHVELSLPPGAAQRELQLPVWNATYQVRDFAEFVLWSRARNSSGAVAPSRKLNKSRWQVQGVEQGGAVEYDVVADTPGPFGSQLNMEHAFFNLAQILMYPVDARDSPMTVEFGGIPAGWRVASADADDLGILHAANYDVLVDSPVELGKFQQTTFLENGGRYRVVVHAPPEVYDPQKLTDTLRKIVHAETTWMQDRPFQEYLFLFHFPPDRGDGGMEHAYSTAIELSARSLKSDPDQLAAMAAHEFFHLWNVKRIRPQSLAPVDYTRENYTRALWFSEGVTSTVEQYALLKSGLMDQPAFLRNLSEEITALQNRPAHSTQSAEESSLDAWLEKYPAYRQPARSVSYYNKGFLLGILLDLQMRKASADEGTLQELFLFLNQTYAHKGQFFDDSEGIRKAAESVSGADFSAFFRKYVSGTDELPYDDSLSWVGLRVLSHEKVLSDAGFRAARNFDTAPAVVFVTPEGEAARAGLVAGDAIISFEGLSVSRDFETHLAGRPVGDLLHVRVRASTGAERDLSWKLVARKTTEYEVVEVERPTLQQLLHRKAWLGGDAPTAPSAGKDKLQEARP